MAEKDRAASSVLGVILLVAVAVILATVVSVGSFSFLNSPTEPHVAQFDTTDNGGFGDAEASSVFQAEMVAGDSIPVQRFSVRIGGDSSANRPVNVIHPPEEVSSGDVIEIEQTASNGIVAGEDITFIYTDQDQQSSILLDVTTEGGSSLSMYDSEFIFTAYPVGSQPSSPWTITTNSPSGQRGELSVSDTRARVGDRSVRVFVEDSTGSGTYLGSGSATASLSQVDLTDVSEISFQFTDTGGPSGTKDEELEVAIDGTTQSDTVQSVDGDWKTATVDVSSFSGDHTVSFSFGEEDAGGSTTIYFDDVQFLDSQGNTVPLADLQD